MKLETGMQAPDFTAPCHLGKDVTLSLLKGKTVVIAFYPAAWTPVCTGQIPSYEALHDTFAKLDVQVLGISTDHVPCLRAWAESLGGINYPLVSDFWPHGAIAEKFGVFKDDGQSERAVFIIDKDGILRYIDVHNIHEQPDNEVLLAELKKIIPDAEDKLKHLYHEDEDLPNGGVVIYCTPWCPSCREARVWLKDHNVPFREVDISTNLTAARQVRSWGNGYQITPTFDIDGQIVLDFDENKLDELLLKK